MKTIERVPIVQQVVDNLKDYILSGERAVGDKMPTEMALCELLGVGRGTVREALRILQANGFVEIQPGRGAFVARTEEANLDDLLVWFAQNEVELKDCMEVRSAIEPLSISLAVERCTDEEVAELQAIHDGFLQAVDAGNATEIARFDERFHNKIIELSHNMLLVSINKQVSECIQNFRGKTFQLEQNVQNAVKPHSDIMSAMRSRDAEAAELFMRRHIGLIIEDLNSSIRK